MAKILVSVQAEQFSDEEIRQLESVLRRNYQTHVSDESVTVLWCILPEGQCYTNYERSRSSFITMECASGFDQQQRETALRVCADAWAAITRQDADEVVLSLFESDLFAEALRAGQQRLSRRGRFRFNCHLLRSLLVSRWRRGFLAFSPNL